MTLAQLITHAAQRGYATKKGTRHTLDLLFAEIAAAVRRGETVSVPGFGVFFPKRVKARRVIAPPGSPIAGEVLSLPATETIGFRAAKAQKRMGVLQ